MKTRESVLERRLNVWIFLILTILLRGVSEKAETRSAVTTVEQLLVALRAEPDAFEWHDQISDYYFLTGKLKRSLFHRREAIRILGQEERLLDS